MKRFVIIMLTFTLGMLHVAARDMQHSGGAVTINGIVKDAHTKKKLANVSVHLQGREIGTVTNGDGMFSLKIDREDLEGNILLSCLGYANRRIACRDLSGNSGKTTVFLTPATRTLDEVTVYGGDAKNLVVETMKRIDANYPQTPNMLNMFYRETIMKGSRYVGISEGVMDVYKNGYGKRTTDRDRVRIKRGRRLMNQKANDTLAVKLQGGPLLAVYLDIVKNGDVLFDDETIPLYSFKHEQMTMLDDRLHYAVSFKPCATVDYPLYSGTLYIDSESLCLTRAEISLDVSDREKTNRALLQRKPFGLRFRCREASIIVAYRQHDGRACLDYIRNTIRFKCDWKRRLFSSTYTTVAEMVTVDLDNQPAANIPHSESYRDSRMFYDDARQNWDTDFWQDYNIIEPTESLEKAVEKLRRHNKKDK